MRVELVVLQLHGADQGRPLGPAAGGVRLALLDLLPHLLLGLRLGEAEHLEELAELAARLVGPGHDLLRDRGALLRVRLKQAGPGLAAQDGGQLPGEVVGVLHGRVGAEAVRRRVPVHRVAGREDPPPLQVGRVHLVVAPQAGAGDLDLEVGHAEQVPHDLGRLACVHRRRRLADVVAPDDQPLVPRPDHPDQAGPDAADVGAGLDHPVEDAGAGRDLGRDVGLEGDVHRARDVHLALVGQADVLGDQRPGAVGADQVLGPDRVGRPGEPVPHGGGHAVVVLLVAQVLGREPALGAARGGVLDQDRLQVGLRDVADQAGRGELVVGLAGRVGAPGLDPADLLARDRRAEHGVADQLVRRRVREHLVLDARGRGRSPSPAGW